MSNGNCGAALVTAASDGAPLIATVALSRLSGWARLPVTSGSGCGAGGAHRNGGWTT